MRALDELRVESDDLRASRKRLVLAADVERRGLERALHDGVQQQLVGLAANLELAAGSVDADPAAAKELLAEMARDIRDAMDQSRKLADRIYPPQLEVGSLVAATVAITAQSHGGALEFDIVVDGDLHADRSLLCDRIEALGGRCAIESGSGHRTRVIGSLPLAG